MILDTSHDDIWLHHWIAESEFVGAFLPFSHKYSATLLRDEFLKVLLECVDSSGPLENV